MYKYGYGVEQNYPESLKWLQISAESGYPLGQFNFGAMYANGTGVARDYEEAAKWYLQAAENGSVSAQFSLGDMYLAGDGVPQSYATAGRMYLAAAQQGHSESQYNVGEMFAAGYGGIPQNFTLAYVWAEMAVATATDFRRGRAQRNRDAIAQLLSPVQLEQAQELARRCRETGFRICE